MVRLRASIVVFAAAAAVAAAAASEEAGDYWDGQCTPCPSALYKKDHCLEGGDLVGERACGPLKLHCEGRCRPPQSSTAPKPTFYWDGVCKPCPASLYDHCPKGGRLVEERGCGFWNLYCEGKCMLPAPAPESADWVIVGAGASGCAAAAALSDAGEDVLVLERGQSDRNPEMKDTQQAGTWPAVVNTEATQKIRWKNGVWGAVANVLGGGTSVNGGLFLEEEPEFLRKTFGDDFDLNEFYASSKKIADNLATPLKASSFGKDFADALADADLGARDPPTQLRMKDGSWVAYATINTSKPQWPRRGAAVLLHERAHLPNLRFLTRYQVARVQIEGQKATGVIVRDRHGHEVAIPARKGVILAAGAIFTPQLLQLSGIGEEAHLRNIGVIPKVDSPNVGKNFIDRNVLPLGVWTKTMEPLYIGYAMAANKSLGLTIESEGWGEVTSEFALSSLALVPPDQRTDALGATLKLLFSTGLQNIMNTMIQLVALQHNTRSRGSVKAWTSDPTEAPKVDANYFEDRRDLEQQLTSLKTLLRLLSSEKIQEYVEPKTFLPPDVPMPDFMSCFAKTPDSTTRAIVLPCLPHGGSPEERYYEYFRNTIVSSYHYFGTAAHGSVVEGADFHVKGTSNLHVVDASVFPRPTRVNPQGTIMAMGHYIGKRILGEQRRRLQEESDERRQSEDIMV